MFGAPSQADKETEKKLHSIFNHIQYSESGGAMNFSCNIVENEQQ